MSDDALEADLERLKKQWFESRSIPDPEKSPPYARRSDVQNAEWLFHEKDNLWRIDGRIYQMPVSLKRWASARASQSEKLSPEPPDAEGPESGVGADD